MQKLQTGNRNFAGGSALIIVLASLVFISALTVAFLMSMRSKLVLSKSGSDSSNVKMLAETAVNIAISQVRDATMKSGTQSLAWASQPGMIRLYNNAGNAAGYYKLYSADIDSMVADSGAFDPGTELDLIKDWNKSPGVFCDLNAPAATGVFPILDYNAAKTLLGGTKTGISLGEVPGATTDRPAPMPVKWIYVLADGTLASAAPDPSSSGSGAVIAAATSQNPIVGRIAFWADDETCKINVNTASDGSFWSTPRFNTTGTAGERALATSQPVRGEYQRYPGHPATVSLKAVFPTLTSEQIFSIAPRLSWGGSEGGSKTVTTATTWITTDHDRLYDSMDEVLFKVPSSGTNRDVQDILALDDRPALATVKASRFFLTATSRAPELNLFGLPRIATWPIHAVNDNNYRTTNDRLLAFCSTIGTSGTSYPFYFTREKNVDPIHDISLGRNLKLLDYLDRLTGQQIPGFGGTFKGKYTEPETRQILTEIYDYIRCTNLFDCTTPQSPANCWPYAFGISTRYTKGTNDHKSASSLGTAVPAYHNGWKTQGFGGRFLQISAAHIHFVGVGKGAVTIGTGEPAVAIDPLQPGTRASGISTDGVPPPNTIAVQAFIYLSTLTPSEGIERWSPGHWIEIEGLDQFGIELNPANRTTPGVPNYTSLGFPQGTGTMCFMGNMLGGGGVEGGRIAGLDPFSFTQAQNVPKKLEHSDPSDSRKQFPFYSAILPVDNTASPSTMAFKGGTIKIRIYADAAAQGNGPFVHGELIETLSLTFPDAPSSPPPPTTGTSGISPHNDPFPVPKLAARRLVGSGLLATSNTNERWNVQSTYFEANPDDDSKSNDVLRTIPLDKGDLRLVVGSTANSYYVAQPDYYNSSVRMLPSFKWSFLNRGKLVKDAAYSQDKFAPYVPNHLNGVTTVEGAPGDWDNGTAVVGDGPFINAADPGSITTNSSTALPPYFDNEFGTASTNNNFFSPNRQMPGPGMFGSLSTGVQRNLPWQTLLFRPGPSRHPGLGSPVSGPPYTQPPDHLFLDLFWMPVVEPYAISESFSTAGKINMNQQIIPFTYIERMVGLRAAFASEKVAMVGKSLAGTYKMYGAGWSGANTDSRFALNLSENDGTLRQFKEKFGNKEIFRSASEICSIYLVPDGKSWTSDSDAQSKWYGDDFALVGDNTRERPYAHMYNKLTTKSNTFTVHYQVQILQRSQTRNLSAPTIFDPGKGDKVVAEQRGATTFERYLDPADARIIKLDPANSEAVSLEKYYRARIINTSVFNP